MRLDEQIQYAIAGISAIMVPIAVSVVNFAKKQVRQDSRLTAIEEFQDYKDSTVHNHITRLEATITRLDSKIDTLIQNQSKNER